MVCYQRGWGNISILQKKNHVFQTLKTVPSLLSYIKFFYSPSKYLSFTVQVTIRQRKEIWKPFDIYRVGMRQDHMTWPLEVRPLILESVSSALTHSARIVLGTRLLNGEMLIPALNTTTLLVTKVPLVGRNNMAWKSTARLKPHMSLPSLVYIKPSHKMTD